jgi:hypothetical protein
MRKPTLKVVAGTDGALPLHPSYRYLWAHGIVIGDFVVRPGTSGDHLTDGADIGAGRRIAPQLYSARRIRNHADRNAIIGIAALVISILSPG